MKKLIKKIILIAAALVVPTIELNAAAVAEENATTNPWTAQLLETYDEDPTYAEYVQKEFNDHMQSIKNPLEHSIAPAVAVELQNNTDYIAAVKAYLEANRRYEYASQMAVSLYAKITEENLLSDPQAPSLRREINNAVMDLKNKAEALKKAVSAISHTEENQMRFEAFILNRLK